MNHDLSKFSLTKTSPTTAMKSFRLWSLFDQCLSSLTNVIMSVLIAHAVSRKGFASYAIMYSAFWICIGGFRAGINSLMLIVAHDEDNVNAKLGSAVGTSVVFGGLSGVVLITIGWSIGGTTQSLIALGFAMPILAWQDAERYAYFALRRAGPAIFIDTIWLLLMIGGAIPLYLLKVQSLTVWVLMWTCGAGISALIGLLIWGPKVNIRNSRRFLSAHQKLASQMLSEFLVSSGVQQVVVFVVPAVAGLLVLASLKAAQVAVGPMNVLLTATSVAVLPNLAAMHKKKEFSSMRREGLVLAGINIALGVSFAAILIVIPASLGRLALGANWTTAKVIAPVIALQIGFNGISQGAFTVLQAMRLAGRNVLVRLGIAPVTLGLAIGGAAVWGIKGLAYGLLLASVLGAIMWWIILNQTLRKHAEAGQSSQFEDQEVAFLPFIEKGD